MERRYEARSKAGFMMLEASLASQEKEAQRKYESREKEAQRRFESREAEAQRRHESRENEAQRHHELQKLELECEKLRLIEKINSNR